MFKTYLKLAGCIGLVLIGLVFFEMIFMESWEVGQIFFMIFCGLVFILAGVMLFFVTLPMLQLYRKEDEIERVRRMFLPGFEESPDRTELEYAITIFRQHYSDFFESLKETENASVQKDITQVFRNILEFRKQRLMRLGISCELDARRMIYENQSGVSAHAFSDGKYEMEEAREEIAAKTIYRKDGKTLFTKLDRDIAHYTLIHAKQIGSGQVICPNCGTVTTRAALLDGCDFCKTKFTVEDLGTRISEFALRTDYDIEYAKFKHYRKRVFRWITLLTTAAVFLLCLVMSINGMIDVVRQENIGFFMTIACFLFVVLFTTACFTPFVLLAVGTVLSPLILAVTGYQYASKQVLKNLKNAARLDGQITAKVREHDPQFSLANFYSGVQNKLASVIFAENEAQIQAFANCDLSGLLERYRNVVGMDVEYLGVQSYDISNGRQFMKVRAVLKLTEFTGEKCRLRKEESIELLLVKAAESHTQAVCGPSVMTCRGCGASLSLLEGKKCRYCGREIPMEQYDWMIEAIRIKAKKF